MTEDCIDPIVSSGKSDTVTRDEIIGIYAGDSYIKDFGQYETDSGKLVEYTGDRDGPDYDYFDTR